MCSTNHALKYFGIQLQTTITPGNERSFTLTKGNDTFEVQDDIYGSAQFQLEQMVQDELGSYPTPPSTMLTLAKVKSLYEASGSEQPLGKWYDAALVNHIDEVVPPTKDIPTVASVMDMTEEEIQNVRYVQWPSKALAQKFVKETFPGGALNDAGDVFETKPSVFSQLRKAKTWVLERLEVTEPAVEKPKPVAAEDTQQADVATPSWADEAEADQAKAYDPVADMNKWFHFDMNLIPLAQREEIYWPLPPSAYTGKEKRNFFATIPNGVHKLSEVIELMLPSWPCGEPPYPRDLKVKAIIGQLIRFKAQLKYVCQTNMLSKTTI